MDDTTDNIKEIMFEKMKELSGVERLKIGFSMFAMAKELVLLSLPPLPESERRVHVFLRLYGNDFDDIAIGKITAWLRANGQE